MTLFVSFRAGPVAGGTLSDPMIFETEAATGKFQPLTPEALARCAEGRRVLFATHGFNVNQADGIARLSHLETALRSGATPLGGEVIFVGVIWPGDFWLPVINYPFEGSTATSCGRFLAKFCDRHLAKAVDLSFISHSLGARLILEAAGHLSTDPAMLCLTAAAVNGDSLSVRHARAANRAGRVYNLSSKQDRVLRLAFPVGDILGDLLNENDGSHFIKALGYAGVQREPRPPRLVDRPIPDAEGYGHGSYLPPATPDPAGPEPWQKVRGFMADAFFGRVPAWP